MTLDPRTHAVRADLADVRLAELVFAPHYAEAVERRLATEATLRCEREPASETIGTLFAGERFELLDLIGDDAWGIAPERTLVGWLPADALA